MPASDNRPRDDKRRTVLLVEDDVIVRYALAEFLRACHRNVVEASSGQEARIILVAGPEVNVLLSDAQLAEDDNGFELAQWVRRHRPAIDVILTSSIAHKAQVVTDFCGQAPGGKPDWTKLASRIKTMIAECKRRLRPPPLTAASAPRRTRR